MAVAPERIGEFDEAHQVYKQVKVGLKDTPDLTVKEIGYLYLFFPEVLPDVDRGGGSP